MGWFVTARPPARKAQVLLQEARSKVGCPSSSPVPPVPLGPSIDRVLPDSVSAAVLAWMFRTPDGGDGASSNDKPFPLLLEPLLSSQMSRRDLSQHQVHDEQGPSENDDEQSTHYAARFLESCNPIKLVRFARRRTAEHCHNLSLSELSGSLGDLGTFIPLTVALARERKIALAPALFWAGMSNIITGYAWDVPMCVQPMKSISAVALTDVAAGKGGDASQGLSAESVTTAGILTGAAVLFLGVTNLMELVNVIVPLTVVSGLQVGVGLRLASKGINDVAKLDWGGGFDCIGLAIACAVMCMFWLRDNERGMKRLDGQQGRDSSGNSGEASKEGSSRTLSGTASNSAADSSDSNSREEQLELGGLSTAQQLDTAEEVRVASPSSTDAEQSTSLCPRIMRRLCCCFNPAPVRPHPVGIYLLLIGSVFAAITLATAGPDSDYDLPLTWFGAPVVINAMENVTLVNWRQGFLQGALPQLPLTTLNSVISVCVLAHSLYPEKRQGKLVAKNRTDSVVTRREVSISVGLMNVLLCPLGSMPNCHGAGGLAGQHRFGARHGTSVVVLGLAKVS